MKYIYTNEKNEQIEATLERWSWGVVYKPTQKQLEAAENATKQLRQELITERNVTLKKMREKNASQEKLDALVAEYAPKLLQRCVPLQDELMQFSNDGKFHKFAEIEQDRVAVFTMFRTDDKTMLKRFDIEVKDGMQIFHFYRVLGLDYMNKKTFKEVRVYAFGWKTREGAAYNFILPDDRIVSSNSDVDLTKYQI